MTCLRRELDVLLPDIDYVEIPVDWWNAEADKSLLIGVFKHGAYPAWWVLLCERVPSRAWGQGSSACKGAEPRPSPQPHRARAALRRCRRLLGVVGLLHRGAHDGHGWPQGRLLWFARSSCHMRARRKVQSLSSLS